MPTLPPGGRREDSSQPILENQPTMAR